MVIEQGLTVKLTEKNIKYYKEKGYKVDTSVSKYKNHYCSKECHKDFHHKIINMDMARIQENNLKNL